MDGYKAEANKYTDGDIETINEKYDAYICPLADAFRDDFREKLKNYAAFFDKLKIPVVICGVGLRAKRTDDILATTYSFDEEVKRFVSAAINKSATLGLRGRHTGEYLKKLGFIEEKDYTVLGCPSWYIHGRYFPHINTPKINLSSNVAININPRAGEKANRFLDLTLRRYKNSIFVGQSKDDFETFYYGVSHYERNIYYPNHATHYVFEENRGRFYLSAMQWIKELSRYEFCIGNRLHGTIAALLAGVPSVLILSDVRSAEIAEYFGIPVIEEKQLSEDANLEKIINKVDFSNVNKRYNDCFEKYLSFLNLHGIKHIYEEDVLPNSAKLDMETVYPDIRKPFAYCGINEAIARQTIYLEKAINKGR